VSSLQRWLCLRHGRSTGGWQVGPFLMLRLAPRPIGNGQGLLRLCLFQTFDTARGFGLGLCLWCLASLTSSLTCFPGVHASTAVGGPSRTPCRVVGRGSSTLWSRCCHSRCHCCRCWCCRCRRCGLGRRRRRLGRRLWLSRSLLRSRFWSWSIRRRSLRPRRGRPCAACSSSRCTTATASARPFATTTTTWSWLRTRC